MLPSWRQCLWLVLLGITLGLLLNTATGTKLRVRPAPAIVLSGGIVYT